MKTNYDLHNDYIITKFTDRLRAWATVDEQEANYALANGFIVPISSGYYQAKTIIIGVISDNKIVYYRANRK